MRPDQEPLYPWVQDGHTVSITVDDGGAHLEVHCPGGDKRCCRTPCRACIGTGEEPTGDEARRCRTCGGSGVEPEAPEGYCWFTEWLNADGPEEYFTGPHDWRPTELPFQIVWRASGWDEDCEVEWKGAEQVAAPDYVELPNGLVRPCEVDVLICKTCHWWGQRSWADGTDNGPAFDQSEQHYDDTAKDFCEEEMTEERGYCHKVYHDADYLSAAELAALDLPRRFVVRRLLPEEQPEGA